MRASLDRSTALRIRVPRLFAGPASHHISNYSRAYGYGAVACLALSITIWTALASAKRKALEHDRFTLSAVRQDSVLGAFARSEDFSSQMLSFRASSSERSPDVVAPLISPLRDERASDLVGSLEQAQASALDVMWAAHLSKRVMDEGASQPLMVIVRPSPTAVRDSISVRVSVNYDPLAFTLSPTQTSKDVVIRHGQQIGSTSWILRPLKTGSHSIAIEALGDVQALGINVRTIWGLPPSVARLAGTVASLFSFCLSIPWFYDFWRERRKRKDRTLRRKRIEGDQSLAPVRPEQSITP